MDAEQFVQWALDDARTVEERYTIELVIEQGVSRWNSKRGIYRGSSIDEQIERKRQRSLNPAYEPHFTEDSVRKTAEVLGTFTKWWRMGGYGDRPARDLSVFRFFQSLEEASFDGEFTNIEVVTELPRLRKLQLMTRSCEDYRPLARCPQLIELDLVFWRSYLHPVTLWPDFSGLEKLDQLEGVALEGNLLAFPPGVVWPKVRKATLKCGPLDARNVRDLPQVPACEFLTLSGVEKLDGIEAFPRLRNLTVESVVRDFAPLQNLQALTCFTHKEFEPLDVAPLARIPKLHFIRFDTQFKERLVPIRPRDFSPLADAPHLRELQVEGCPPVMTEVAAVNAGLVPWDELFLRAEPLPVPPLRLVLAPWVSIDKLGFKTTPPEVDPDIGLRDCEGRWVSRFVTRYISDKIKHSDWGAATGGGQSRSVTVEISTFSFVDKLPQIIDAAREAIARLKGEYEGIIWINLKATQRKLTKAEKALLEKFEEEREQADFERQRREREEYLERLHRYELKKQEGHKINPKEFAPGEETPLPPPPWERESEEDEDSSGSGDIAVKKKPDPPPSYDDDEHPLADKYNMMGRFNLAEAWFPLKDGGLVSYLMGRAPDKVFPEEPKKQ